MAPFSAWTPGTIVRERRPLLLSLDLTAGVYTVAVGLYDRDSLQRTNPTQTGDYVARDGALMIAEFEHR
jgi:hypothetical protein